MFSGTWSGTLFLTAWGRLQLRKWQGGKAFFFLARYSIWKETHWCFSHLVSKSNKHIRALEILVILSWKHICVFIVLFSIIRNTCVLFYLLGVHEKKTQKTQKTHTKNTLIVLEMGSNNTYVFLMVGSLKMKNTYVLWDSWSKILKHKCVSCKGVSTYKCLRNTYTCIYIYVHIQHFPSGGTNAKSCWSPIRQKNKAARHSTFWTQNPAT